MYRLNSLLQFTMSRFTERFSHSLSKQRASGRFHLSPDLKAAIQTVAGKITQTTQDHLPVLPAHITTIKDAVLRSHPFSRETAFVNQPTTSSLQAEPDTQLSQQVMITPD